MKEKLIEILQLPPTATEEDIIAAATVLMQKAHHDLLGNEHEAEIRKLMQDSLGAISREVAMEHIAARKV